MYRVIEKMYETHSEMYTVIEERYEKYKNIWNRWKCKGWLKKCMKKIDMYRVNEEKAWHRQNRQNM